MVLLNAPVSPRKWPVAIPDALAIVKVGNSECGLAKFTPWSRMAAMVGAVSGVTDRERRPSGTNRMRLRWFCACADVPWRKIMAHAAEMSALERNGMAFSSHSCSERCGRYRCYKTVL